MNKKRSVNVLLLITILLFVVMYMAGQALSSTEAKALRIFKHF